MKDFGNDSHKKGLFTMLSRIMSKDISVKKQEKIWKIN